MYICILLTFGIMLTIPSLYGEYGTQEDCLIPHVT